MMDSKVLKSAIAIALAGLLALPVSIAVNGITADEVPGIVNSPGHEFSENAVASLGDSLYQVWVDGPQHESRLMLSMSSDSGIRWTEPVALTGPDYNPMDVQMIAGTQKMHIVWQDGLSKLLRTGYMSIDVDGTVSKINVYNGENPSILASGNIVAYSYVLSGEMNVQISYNEGLTFTHDQPMKGLVCQDNRLAYSEGRIEMVAFGGIRNIETGQVKSSGLYFECLTCVWPAPQFLTSTGPVTDLMYDGTSITWSEISGHTKFIYGLAKKSGGEFGEKCLISSEDIPRAPESTEFAQSRLPPKKWTFVCYLDGDNSLASFATTDLNEMELVGSNADINIIALYDLTGAADSKCYYVTYDTNMGAIASTIIPLSSINPTWSTEVNMGDPQTAIDLMNYVYINYPAARYAWDFWDHGGSWNWMQCEDAVSSDELTALETREIYETLRADTGRRYLWDVVTFDECILADNEVAYDAKQYVNFTCFSEDSIAGDGFDYTAVLDHLKNNPGMGGEEFSAWVCHEYYADYPTGTSLSTLSSINTTAYDYELMEAIEDFGQKMRHKASTLNAQIKSAASTAIDWQGITYQPDLRHFAQLITTGISNATDAEINAAAWRIIALTSSNAASDTYGSGTWQHDRPILIHDANTNANGLTIYANEAYDNTFDSLNLASYSNWGKFVQNVWGTSTNVVNEEPGCIIADPTEGGNVVSNSFVTITGTASDTDGTVQRVEVKIDRENWQNAVGTTSWSYSWNTNGWELGPHRITARAYDGVDYSSDWYELNVQMVDVSSNGTVDIQLPEYPQEAPVKVTVKDTDLNTGSGVQTTTITVTSVREPAGESLILTETGGDTSVFEGYLTISAINAAGILWVNAADTITATYYDADYGGTGPMTLIDTAIVDGTPPGPPSGLTVEWYGFVQEEFFQEDFEGDGTPTFGELGWTTGGASNDWQVGTPAGLGTPADPTGAYGGTYSIGNDLTGLGTYPGEYENSLAIDSNYIYSPAIDCSGYSSVQLQFARYLGIETSTYDHVYIEASTSTSGPWTQIWTNSATISDTAWSTVSYDISSIADDQASVYVRFELGVTDGSVTYCGWNIDNLALLGMTSGTMHNTVNWTLSSDDGAGANDVVGYNIYRSSAQAGPWDAATLIDTAASGIATYLDTDRGEFDGINWWYLVRAEDNMGNEDTNTNAVPEIPTTNIAPSAPNNPTPANGAIGVSINPTLSVRAADPNGDPLTVSFYNVAGPALIGTNYNVPSGTYTTMPWNGLAPTTTYSWYATAYDGEFTTQSSTWSFTTIDMTPPGPATGLTVEWTGTTSGTALDEDFSGGIPGTWTIVDGGSGGGAAATWTTANPGGRTPTSPITTPFAIVDSDYAGSSATQDEQLITPVMNLASATAVTLEFDQYFYYYSTEVGDVDVRSSNTGGVWTNMLRNTGSSSPNPNHRTIDITPQAAGASDVQVRFYYYNGVYEWYWMVDNVVVTFIGGGTTDDNLLTWTLSADDGAGADDVDHYNIYRAVGASGPWDAGAVIDTVPAGTDTYTDIGRGEVDGINWWYVVRAEDIWGNEEMNTNAVPEEAVSTITYAIDLAGKPANSWVFVSFPIAVSGNIQTLLNDATLGDGATTWTVAKWYNPQTPADPWKTYRTAGTANDMPTLTNTMGLWLWITANGGDQDLTVAVEGAYPAAAATVNLYLGWNLVGYPSATARLGSATLPPQADRVSFWQPASPYISDSTPVAVTMSHGNAYWVHVTADCIWTVTP